MAGRADHHAEHSAVGLKLRLQHQFHGLSSIANSFLGLTAFALCQDPVSRLFQLGALVRPRMVRPTTLGG